jgi:hypothetical protein
MSARVISPRFMARKACPAGDEIAVDVLRSACGELGQANGVLIGEMPEEGGVIRQARDEIAKGALPQERQEGGGLGLALGALHEIGNAALGLPGIGERRGLREARDEGA